MMRPPRRRGALFLAGIFALASALYVPPVLAGDEDMSPSAYQEFDPVTGFMVTVDPNAEHDSESPKNSTEHESVDSKDKQSRSRQGATGALYVLVLVAAGLGVVLWIRRRAQKNSPL